MYVIYFMKSNIRKKKYNSIGSAGKRISEIEEIAIV